MANEQKTPQIVIVTDTYNGFETEYIGVETVLYTALNFTIYMNDGRRFNFMKPFYSYRFKTVVSE